jgi:ubiquitin-conjugating enzyme E2 J2
MANDICVRRLTKELAALKKDPMKEPSITVAPNEANLLEMHYVMEGSVGTPYEGGVYHGKLIFPKEYPLKPPGVIMLTPSGRFQPGRRLCLSMSDFHPESWNPMWSVSTILTGLYSFMIESKPTMGSIETSFRKKRQLAMVSLEYNVLNDKVFAKLFPEYVVRYETEKANRALLLSSEVNAAGAVPRPVDRVELMLPQGAMAAVAGIVAILSIVLASRFI